MISSRPTRVSCASRSCFTRAMAKVTSRCCSSVDQPPERVRRGDVELHDRFGVEQEPVDRRLLGVDRLQRPGPEVLGVREAQRGVVAEHEQPRDLAARWGSRRCRAVPRRRERSRAPTRAAGRSGRTGRPRTGPRRSGSRPGRRTRARRPGRRSRGPAPRGGSGPSGTIAAHVDQAQGGEDHDPAQRSPGDERDQPGTEQDDDRRPRWRRSAGGLAVGADGVDDRRARPGGAEREAAGQARRDVRGAQREELTVRVDDLAGPGRRTPDRSAPRPCRRRRRSPRRTRAAAIASAREIAGSPTVGSPPGTGPTSATPCAWRLNTEAMTVAPTTAISAPGASGQDAPQDEEERRHAEAERDRRRLDVPGLAPQLDHLGDRPVGEDGDPGDRRQLRSDHDQRDAGHVAHQDRLRQQVGEEPEPQGERGEADRSDEQGEPRGQRRVPAAGRRPRSARRRRRPGWPSPTRARPTAGGTSRAARRRSSRRPPPTARSPARRRRGPHTRGTGARGRR